VLAGEYYIWSYGASEIELPSKAEVVYKSNTAVVIKINEAEDFKFLLDAMNYLKDEGELSFEINDGLVTSIEGVENASDWSKWWGLYSSDSEMANTEWGTVTVNGKVYGSAILGADALEVLAGEYYVWSYSVSEIEF
jgi:hypothetical protein